MTPRQLETIRKSRFLKGRGWAVRQTLGGVGYYLHQASGDVAKSLDEAERIERERPVSAKPAPTKLARTGPRKLILT